MADRLHLPTVTYTRKGWAAECPTCGPVTLQQLQQDAEVIAERHYEVGGFEAYAGSHEEDEEASAERVLAKCVLVIAATAGMPDSFWASDSRITAACAALGWSPAEARGWARQNTSWSPNSPEAKS